MHLECQLENGNFIFMKKKFAASSKDKKEWSSFTSNLKNVYNKDEYIKKKDTENKKILKLDLHGLALDEANQSVKKFINNASRRQYKKLLVVTGKGLRSKVYNDPYRSEKMHVLKYSVPEFIKNNEDLSTKIKRISEADIKDGGEGAFYIFLK